MFSVGYLPPLPLFANYVSNYYLWSISSIQSHYVSGDYPNNHKVKNKLTNIILLNFFVVILCVPEIWYFFQPP